MNKRLYVAGCVLLVMLVLLPVATVSAGGNVGPRTMLRAYYDAINARDYGTAYVQWFNPIQTYENFVAGYSTTTRVDAYFGGFQPNGISSIEGGVPTVLIGYHADGSVVAFNGCYNVVYNDQGTGMAQWLISGASIQPLSFVPDGSSIQHFLKVLCYPRYTYDNFEVTQYLLIDYFDAINRGDYLAAYNLWFTPHQIYENFAAGYADTTEAVMFYGPFEFSGYYTAADAGRVPVVLFGYHTDGSMTAFQGCIHVGYNGVTWGISDSAIAPLAYLTAPDDAAIQQVLAASCYSYTGAGNSIIDGWPGDGSAVENPPLYSDGGSGVENPPQ